MHLWLYQWYNGAEGDTKGEIAEALALKGISVDDLNRANESIMAILKKDSETVHYLSQIRFG